MASRYSVIEKWSRPTACPVGIDMDVSASDWRRCWASRTTRLLRRVVWPTAFCPGLRASLICRMTGQYIGAARDTATGGRMYYARLGASVDIRYESNDDAEFPNSVDFGNSASRYLVTGPQFSSIAPTFCKGARRCHESRRSSAGPS